MTRPSPRLPLRPRILGAASALLLFGACSAATGDTVSTTAAPVATTAGAAVKTASTATSTTTTTPPPDPALLLADALASYSGGYAFTATTTVNGQVASVQTGSWLGGTSEMTVVSGDGEVEYVITEAGQWARLPGGEWEELEGTPPVEFPLAGLASPTSIEIIEAAAGSVQVATSYAATALGLVGEPITVMLLFEDGRLVSVSYTTDIDGNTAESVTTLDALLDTTPITAPPG